ncbi:MAG: SDR family oxidoreductase [Candidatus Sedimenticola endophacoides]
MKDPRPTVLVTGASRGIGRAVCEKLLAEGCHVIGVARSMSTSGHWPSEFTGVDLDLGRLDALPEALKALRRTHPGIGSVICNAGVGRFGSLEEFSARQIRELIDINLTSQVLLAREFLPHLKRHGENANLIFMGSEAALAGGARGAVYAATKFALRGLAQSLREECAASPVRIGIVNPGMVRSSFFDHLGFAPGDAPDNHLQPTDVAEAVWLMMSARPGAVIDEIYLSPRKKVIHFGERKRD